MIRIQSSKDLLDSFRAIDRDQVQLPDTMKFPFILRDYMAWVEPSGHRVYLVFEEPQKKTAYGVSFKRTPAQAEAPAQMCQWCHTVSTGQNIGLLTADVSTKRKIGVYLCRNLQCKERISTPGVNDIRESLVPERKLERVLLNMREFAQRNLF